MPKLTVNRDSDKEPEAEARREDERLFFLTTDEVIMIWTALYGYKIPGGYSEGHRAFLEARRNHLKEMFS